MGFLRTLRPCVVGMEACGGAHHWARALSKLGHQVRLMSPALVAPYRKGNQHDRNDADAVLEAVSRPSMRFVAVKTIAQQDVLALHRVRARLLKQRIALSNQIRALLHERGGWRRGWARRDCARQWRQRWPLTTTSSAPNCAR
jgi:transposase